jgi:hypothetical protein
MLGHWPEDRSLIHARHGKPAVKRRNGADRLRAPGDQYLAAPALLVGFTAANRDDQAAGAPFHIAAIDCDELRPSKRAGETE